MAHADVELTVAQRLTQGRFLQAANIHRAGLGVFTEKEGDGKEKLFIEEVLKDGKYWRYKPRRGDTTGGGCAGKLLRREGSERNGVSFGVRTGAPF